MTNEASKLNADQLSSLALAYMGDAIIDVYVREAVIAGGTMKPHELHKKTTAYVSAKAQAKFLHQLLDEGDLTDEEASIVRRGRNAKPHSVPRNTDVQTYNFSTGFEALIGYLHFSDRSERVEQIMSKMLAMRSDRGEAQVNE